MAKSGRLFRNGLWMSLQADTTLISYLRQLSRYMHYVNPVMFKAFLDAADIVAKGASCMEKMSHSMTAEQADTISDVCAQKFIDATTLLHTMSGHVVDYFVNLPLSVKNNSRFNLREWSNSVAILDRYMNGLYNQVIVNGAMDVVRYGVSTRHEFD